MALCFLRHMLPSTKILFFSNKGVLHLFITRVLHRATAKVLYSTLPLTQCVIYILAYPSHQLVSEFLCDILQIKKLRFRILIKSYSVRSSVNLTVMLFHVLSPNSVGWHVRK